MTQPNAISNADSGADDSPAHTRQRREPDGWSARRAVAAGLVTVGAFWFLASMDRLVYLRALAPQTEAWPAVRALKFLGTVWPWLAAAGALFALDAARASRRAGAAAEGTGRARANDAWVRGAFLLSSAVAGGALAEVLKIVFRRERPEYHDGAHVFRSFVERPFYGGGLDLPSSHAGTAFGAAWALCALFPRWAWLWLALAGACAATRVAEGAHFVSGVFLGAATAWAASGSLARLFGVGGAGRCAC